GVPRRPGSAVKLPVQAAAGEVLQLEEWETVGLADVVDADYVRMLESGDDAGLGEEAGDGLGCGGGAGPDHLGGAGAAEPDLPGQVDHAHAATAEFAEDLIARYRRRGATRRFIGRGARAGNRPRPGLRGPGLRSLWLGSLGECASTQAIEPVRGIPSRR